MKISLRILRSPRFQSIKKDPKLIFTLKLLILIERLCACTQKPSKCRLLNTI